MTVETSAPPDAPILDQRLAFGVHRLSAQMTRICNPLFREYKVDQIGCQILVLALEGKGVGAGDIVTSLAVPQSTVSHQLKRLEALGYLERRRDAADQRVVCIHLTATGRLVANACNVVSLQVYAAMIGDMAPEKVAQLRTDMAAMITRLDALQAGGSPTPL